MGWRGSKPLPRHTRRRALFGGERNRKEGIWGVVWRGTYFGRHCLGWVVVECWVGWNVDGGGKGLWMWLMEMRCKCCGVVLGELVDRGSLRESLDLLREGDAVSLFHENEQGHLGAWRDRFWTGVTGR